jgi:mono/diheme cytochrome c family protein
MAMHSAVLLTQEVKELRAANERLTRKKSRRRTQLQRRGVLQVQEGQNRISEIESREQENMQQDVDQGRRRVPPTCSSCHIQGYTIRQYRQTQRIS